MRNLVFLYFAAFAIGSSIARILTAEQVYFKIKEAVAKKDKDGTYILTPMSTTENGHLKLDREIRLRLVTTSVPEHKGMPNKGLYIVVKAIIPISKTEDYVDAQLVERDLVEPELVDTRYATPDAPTGEEVLTSKRNEYISYAPNCTQPAQDNVNQVIEVEVDYFADEFWKALSENPEVFFEGSKQLAIGVAVLSLKDERTYDQWVEIVIQIEPRKPHQVMPQFQKVCIIKQKADSDAKAE